MFAENIPAPPTRATPPIPEPTQARAAPRRAHDRARFVAVRHDRDWSGVPAHLQLGTQQCDSPRRCANMPPLHDATTDPETSNTRSGENYGQYGACKLKGATASTSFNKQEALAVLLQPRALHIAGDRSPRLGLGDGRVVPVQELLSCALRKRGERRRQQHSGLSIKDYERQQREVQAF